MMRVRTTGREHELKTWPEPFQAIVEGYKGFEIRRNDRAYAVGDKLKLREYDPAPFNPTLGAYPPKGYTGRWLRCTVQYLALGGQWGLPSDVCVMSIGDFEHIEGSVLPQSGEKDR